MGSLSERLGRHRRPRSRSFLLPALLTFAAVPAAGHAASDDGQGRPWTIQIDDDFLALTQHDRDYTAGAYFTLVDDGPVADPLPLSRSLDRVNELTRFTRLSADTASATDALEFGLRLFTPSELETERALPDDRPYATLTYVANSKLTVDPGRSTALQSSLTLGLLGLPITGALHRALHQLIGSPLPNGYSHQISDGGEPTFRYAVSRQRLLTSGTRGERPYSVRYGLGASIGYVAEVSAELVLRSGPLRAPWWAAPPMSSDYAGQPAMIARPGPGAASSRGVVFEAGIESRLRLYNAFLQGQFRRSDVTFSSDELNNVLLEGWVGVAFRFRSGLELSYTIRRQSREIEHGTGARAFTWGSLSFAGRL
jgi:hypothetical protein